MQTNGQQTREDRSVVMGSAAGIVVGLVWIAMAAAALWSAGWGASNSRPDWALAWGLVGTLLLVAGCAALAGSIMHRNWVRSHH